MLAGNTTRMPYANSQATSFLSMSSSTQIFKSLLLHCAPRHVQIFLFCQMKTFCKNESLGVGRKNIPRHPGQVQVNSGPDPDTGNGVKKARLCGVKGAQ